MTAVEHRRSDGSIGRRGTHGPVRDAGGEDDPRYPPTPFPIGWFQIAYAEDLAPGDVRPLRYLGRDLVLWRGETGDAHVMDAHCAHLGAHLGHGGVVVGDRVRCPFHAWEYTGDGRCSRVPYGTGRIHRAAAVRSHPLIERNGLLLMWWHPSGAAPAWDIPEIPEWDSEAWTDYLRHEWHVDTHWQEIVENAADTSHFHYLHGTEIVPTLPEYSFEGHIMHVRADHVFRSPVGPKAGSIDTWMHGPGWGTVRIQIEGMVQILFPQSIAPVDVGHVHVQFSFMTERRRALLGTRLSKEIIGQIDADAPIWEHKIYRPRPKLADGDGPVLEYRRWAAQFYVDADTREPGRVEAVA